MSLLRSIGTISFLTLMSRILGLVRDMLIARYFGVSVITDAFYVAFRLPNMLRRLFAEGAFQQAFVPMLSKVVEGGDEKETKTFIDHVFTVLGLALFVTSILGVLASPFLVWILASGLRDHPAAFDLASDLTRFMFPYIAFMSLVALSSSILNVYRRFAIPAATPILLNVSFIVFTIVLVPYLSQPVWALAIAVMVGGAMQLGLQAWALWRLGICWRPRALKPSFQDPNVRKVMALMVPALFGVGVAQLSLLINTNIASHISEGAVTWLTYSDRLMEFPTAILGVAIGTVLLPNLSRAWASQDQARYNHLVDAGLRFLILVGVPASLGLGILSEGLVAFLFQGRHFSAYDVEQTALAVLGWSFGLLGLIGMKVVAPPFYARQDIKTPVKTAVVALVTTQLINLVMVPVIGHWSLTLSVGLGSVMQVLILLVLLYRRGWYRHESGWMRFGMQIALASLVMAAFLVGINRVVSWTTLDWMHRSLYAMGAVLGAALLYGGVLVLLGWRIRDLKALMGRG